MAYIQQAHVRPHRRPTRLKVLLYVALGQTAALAALVSYIFLSM